MRSFKTAFLLSVQSSLPFVSLASAGEADPLKMLPPELVEKVVDYAGLGVVPLSGVNQAWNGYFRGRYPEPLLQVIQSEVRRIETEDGMKAGWA